MYPVVPVAPAPAPNVASGTGVALVNEIGAREDTDKEIASGTDRENVEVSGSGLMAVGALGRLTLNAVGTGGKNIAGILVGWE